MTAEIFDVGARFEVEPEMRPDGKLGPPARVVISLRPCWRKPVQRFDLEFVREDLDVAYYEIAE
jgi:hypothetical protein